MIYFSGGENQPHSAPTMNQGPMTPMMPNMNMQQSGQMMLPDPRGSVRIISYWSSVITGGNLN